MSARRARDQLLLSSRTRPRSSAPSSTPATSPTPSSTTSRTTTSPAAPSCSRTASLQYTVQSYAVHEETGAPVYMNALDAGTAVAFDSYTFRRGVSIFLWEARRRSRSAIDLPRHGDARPHARRRDAHLRRRALHRRHALRRFPAALRTLPAAARNRAADRLAKISSARRLKSDRHGLLHARDRAPLQPLPDRAAKPRTVKLPSNRRDTRHGFHCIKNALRDKSCTAHGMLWAR